MHSTGEVVGRHSRSKVPGGGWSPSWWHKRENPALFLLHCPSSIGPFPCARHTVPIQRGPVTDDQSDSCSPEDTYGTHVPLALCRAAARQCHLCRGAKLHLPAIAMASPFWHLDRMTRWADPKCPLIVLMLTCIPMEEQHHHPKLLTTDLDYCTSPFSYCHNIMGSVLKFTKENWKADSTDISDKCTQSYKDTTFLAGPTCIFCACIRCSWLEKLKWY